MLASSIGACIEQLGPLRRDACASCRRRRLAAGRRHGVRRALMLDSVRFDSSGDDGARHAASRGDLILWVATACGMPPTDGGCLFRRLGTAQLIRTWRIRRAAHSMSSSDSHAQLILQMGMFVELGMVWHNTRVRWPKKMCTLSEFSRVTAAGHCLCSLRVCTGETCSAGVSRSGRAVAHLGVVQFSTTISCHPWMVVPVCRLCYLVHC